MIIRSPQAVLALIALGLLSSAACTADKTDMRTETSQATAASPPKKLVEGIYATDDHLQPVYFDLNKSKLSDSAMGIVKTNAEYLKTQPPYLIRLVGVSDSRGSLQKNKRLAERRANTLLAAYVAEGVAKERLSVFTQGAEEPACQPVTEACLAKSRRTETWMEDKTVASR